MKILFTGGGSGGHIFPIIAVIREIRKIELEKDFEFFYIGPKNIFWSIFLSNENIKIKPVCAGKFRRYINVKTLFQNLFDILIKTPIGILQAFWYIFFLAPDLIFSKGGYGSIPAVIAGWTLGVPILLQESDVSPGLANKILSKFCLRIFVSFPIQETEYFSSKKIISVGNPIRRELLEGSREKAKRLFKINSKKPVILVMGGSQGSQRINDLILRILPQLLTDFEIIHQTGEKNFKQIKAETQIVIPKSLKEYYRCFSFLKEIELKQAYAICDLIISRAGSGDIFEIAAVGKPSILVPLPEAAQNHQIKNAYSFAAHQACIVLEEENLTPHLFLAKLKYLFSHPENLQDMSKKAKEFARPMAAKTIAEYIINYVKR